MCVIPSTANIQRLKGKLPEEIDAESLLPALLAVLGGDGLQLPSPPRAELPAAEDHRNLATAMLKAPLHMFGQASRMKVPAEEPRCV